MSKYSTRDLLVSISNAAINKEVTNLHISADISKTLSGTPNTAEVMIWNFNQNTREDLYNNVYNFNENIGNTEVTISLDGKRLFTGTLINVNSVYDTTAGEWVTTLYCGDGFNAFRKATPSKRYEKGMTRKEIVEDLMGELESTGVAAKGILSGLNACTDKSLLKSIVVKGEILDNIKRVLSECLGGNASDTDVYVEDGKANVLGKATVIRSNKVIINKDLLEPPTLTEQGINCRVLLNSSLKIGAEFQVEAKSFNVSFGNLTKNRVQKQRISGTGTYKVLELKHTVDNFSDDVATTEIIGLNLLGR